MRLAVDVNGYVAHAAIVAEGRPKLVQLTDNGPGLPAVVRQTMHGLEVGERAAQSLVGNGETSVFGCTLLMGRAERVMEAHRQMPFSLRAEGDEVLCNLLYAEVPITTCYGRLVTEVVRRAEARLGATVDDVVLTVPATAEDRFRVQARRAVEREGIKVHRLINQPTAALLAVDLPRQALQVMVVDVGMATTDAVMAQRGRNGITIKAVKGADGVNGDSFIQSIADHLMQRLQQQAGLNLQTVDGSGVAQAGLAQAVRMALPTLATQAAVQMVLDHGGGFGRDIVLEVSRADVESWTAPYLSDVGAACLRARNSVPVKRLDAVVLIGEMGFWPALQTYLIQTLGISAPMLQVAYEQQLPVLGAALAGMADAPTVWDVTPYPLGINCVYSGEELFSPILPANTPIPTPQQGQKGAFIQSYQTLYPDQKDVRLDILQYRGPRTPETRGANRVYPAECETLGSWLFDNLSPRKGEPACFTVTFSVDRDGILHLCAAETDTSRVLNAKVERIGE